MEDQHGADAYFLVVDLHALTVPFEPERLIGLVLQLGHLTQMKRSVKALRDSVAPAGEPGPPPMVRSPSTFPPPMVRPPSTFPPPLSPSAPSVRRGQDQDDTLDSTLRRRKR